MRRLNLLLVLVGAVLGLAAAVHLPLRAQGDGKPAETTASPERPAASVQDALLRPHAFRFGRPTPLAEVAQRLGRDLGSPVVLDLAALERLDLKPEDTVHLELQGVRLKTGLKLLLDQVGLTFRVVPEDNLLILTDREGSEDPIERVLAEVRELHRDVHTLQDSVDEVREITGLQGGDGARVRKPTIIEELPDHPDAKDKAGAAPAPSRGAEPEAKSPGVPARRPRTSL